MRTMIMLAVAVLVAGLFSGCGGGDQTTLAQPAVQTNTDAPVVANEAVMNTAATGTVQTQVCNAVTGWYTAYLFRTGAASPTATGRFTVSGYSAPIIRFTGTRGYRYFIRVRRDDGKCWQTPDGLLSGSSLVLPQLRCW